MKSAQQDVIYQHFTFTNPIDGDERRATAAILFDDNTDNLSFAVAICKPGDVFSRKEGRQRAYSRLCNAGPTSARKQFTGTFAGPLEDTHQREVVLQEFCRDLGSHRYVDTWDIYDFVAAPQAASLLTLVPQPK